MSCVMLAAMVPAVRVRVNDHHRAAMLAVMLAMRARAEILELLRRHAMPAVMLVMLAVA
jgi:hypothetical protein